MSRVFEYTFFHGRCTDGHRYKKTCSTSLIIRDMQIKTAMKYYLTLLEWLLFKSRNRK